MRPWAPPLSGCLKPELLERVVRSLFPLAPFQMAPPATLEVLNVDDDEVPKVTWAELAKKTTPGPVGIQGRARSWL